MRGGSIRIDGYDDKYLGSNSYDVTLGDKLLTYAQPHRMQNDTDQFHLPVLDCAKENQVYHLIIPDEGLILYPGILYLGVTREATSTKHHVPQLEGKSSIGRLGISVHVTAGFGDIGFEGYWTLEITVIHPIRVYAGMPIAQVFFFLPLGTCTTPYSMKRNAKYSKQPPIPMPSQMHKNFEKAIV